MQRRRIYTEEKEKVVAAVWGTELIQFIATLAILYQDEFILFFSVLVQFMLFFKSSWCKTAIVTPKKWIAVPQTEATTFAFYSVFILLLQYEADLVVITSGKCVQSETSYYCRLTNNDWHRNIVQYFSKQKVFVCVNSEASIDLCCGMPNYSSKCTAISGVVGV